MVDWKLCLLAQLPLHHNSPVQCWLTLHQSEHWTPTLIELPHLAQQLSPNLEGAIHCFPTENHNLRLGDVDSHPDCFILDWKLVWCVLKVTVWWSQQNHIICKEHRSYFEAPKGDTILLLAAPNIIMNRDYPGGDQHLQNTFDFLQRERTQLSLQLYKWMTCSSDCSTPYSHSTLHRTARGHSYKPSTSPQNTCRLDGQTPMTMQDHGKFLLQFAVHHDEAI